jgi:hypothetical protein
VRRSRGALARGAIFVVGLGSIGALLGWIYGHRQMGAHQEPLVGLALGVSLALLIIAFQRPGFRRAIAWGALGAIAGMLLGIAIGAYQVSTLDCSRPITCEWSGLIPIAYGFFGFWIGGAVGAITGAILRRRRGYGVEPQADDVPIG